MTIYYDPTAPMALVLMTWKNTVFSLVLIRLEFWVLVIVHTIIVVLVKEVPLEIGDVSWVAVLMLQLFLTFMLIFYNEICYDRFRCFYTHVTDAMLSLLCFVHELTLVMPHEEVSAHRLGATRYMTASLYIFFMRCAGKAMVKHDWLEVVDRGLITKKEMRVLNELPGGQFSMILTTWALHIVQDALQADPFWREKSPNVAHIQNRLQEHCRNMMRSTNQISYTLAFPISYSYFHTINVALAVNVAMLCWALATYKSYFSIIAFAVALLVFLGIREVSGALVDPFGLDDVDFKIDRFMTYIFDHTVAYLEAWSNPVAYHYVPQKLLEVEEFTDDQLSRPMTRDVFFRLHNVHSSENPFAWDGEMPMQRFADDASVNAKRILYEALVTKPLRDLKLDEGSPSDGSDKAAPPDVEDAALGEASGTLGSVTTDESSNETSSGSGSSSSEEFTNPALMRLIDEMKREHKNEKNLTKEVLVVQKQLDELRAQVGLEPSRPSPALTLRLARSQTKTLQPLIVHFNVIQEEDEEEDYSVSNSSDSEVRRGALLRMRSRTTSFSEILDVAKISEDETAKDFGKKLHKRGSFDSLSSMISSRSSVSSTDKRSIIKGGRQAAAADRRLKRRARRLARGGSLDRMSDLLDSETGLVSHDVSEAEARNRDVGKSSGSDDQISFDAGSGSASGDTGKQLERAFDFQSWEEARGRIIGALKETTATPGFSSTSWDVKDPKAQK